MELSEHDLDFIRANNRAAMITVGQNGIAKVVRVGIALVDGRLWSSSTKDRVRTNRLRRDPRCTLFVFDLEFAFLGLEKMVEEGRIIHEFDVQRAYGLR